MSRGRGVKPGQGSSRRKRAAKPVSSVTKKVRMTEEEAARLAELAASLKMTESELLRSGVNAMEREARRIKAIKELVRMAEEAGPEPPKIHWGLK